MSQEAVSHEAEPSMVWDEDQENFEESDTEDLPSAANLAKQAQFAAPGKQSAPKRSSLLPILAAVALGVIILVSITWVVFQRLRHAQPMASASPMAAANLQPARPVGVAPMPNPMPSPMPNPPVPHTALTNTHQPEAASPQQPGQPPMGLPVSGLTSSSDHSSFAAPPSAPAPTPASVGSTPRRPALGLPANSFPSTSAAQASVPMMQPGAQPAASSPQGFTSAQPQHDRDENAEKTIAALRAQVRDLQQQLRRMQERHATHQAAAAKPNPTPRTSTVHQAWHQPQPRHWALQGWSFMGMIDHDAIIRLPDGQTQTVGVGQTIKGVRILRIETTKVTTSDGILDLR